MGHLRQAFAAVGDKDDANWCACMNPKHPPHKDTCLHGRKRMHARLLMQTVHVVPLKALEIARSTLV